MEAPPSQACLLAQRGGSVLRSLKSSASGAELRDPEAAVGRARTASCACWAEDRLEAHPLAFGRRFPRPLTQRQVLGFRLELGWETFSQGNSIWERAFRASSAHETVPYWMRLHKVQP